MGVFWLCEHNDLQFFADLSQWKKYQLSPAITVERETQEESFFLLQFAIKLFSLIAAVYLPSEHIFSATGLCSKCGIFSSSILNWQIARPAINQVYANFPFAAESAQFTSD